MGGSGINRRLHAFSRPSLATILVSLSEVTITAIAITKMSPEDDISKRTFLLVNMLLLFDVVEVHNQHVLQIHIMVEVLQEVRRGVRKRREEDTGRRGGGQLFGEN